MQLTSIGDKRVIVMAASTEIHATSSSTISHSGGRGRLFGMSWAHFLNDGSANYLPGVLPAVLVALHQPVQMAGTLMAALLIGQALQPLMGWLADRLGGRGMIWLGLTGSTLGGAFLGFAHQVGFLIGFLLLIGIGNSMFHPQALAAVRGLVRDRQGLLLSVFLIGGELGRGVWPTIASWIVVHLGLTQIWLLAIPAVLTVPFVRFWAPSIPRKQGHQMAIRWRQHLGPMSLLIAFASTRSLITYGLVTFIPLLWHLEGGSLISGASIITTLLSVGVIGNLGGGHLADRFGRRSVLIISSIFVVILIPVFMLVHGAWIWVAAAFLGMALFASAPVTILVGQDIFPENRSLGSGIALGLANGIGAMLVFAVGLALTEGTVADAIWFLSLIGIVSAIFAAVLPSSLQAETK